MSIENLPNVVMIDFGYYDPIKSIAVNGEYFFKGKNQDDFGELDFDVNLIKNNIPENIKNDEITSLNWDKSKPSETYINTVETGVVRFELTEENYNKYIKPYVDIWQQIKDKIEQEQEEQEKEYNKFENRQKRALTQLNQGFEDVKNRAHIFSSLGFESDADSTANENITGLLLTIGDSTIQFCDYYNEFHTLNKSQLTTLQNEIIRNAQNLYAQKWQFRTAIENATDNSSLDEAVSQINFTYMDFSTSQS